MTVGQRIRASREKLKISQFELGKLLNKSQGTIAKYENDAAQMDYETLVNFSKIADCTTDYLLGRTDRPEVEIRKAPSNNDEATEYGANKGAPELTAEDIRIIKEFIQKQKEGK